MKKRFIASILTFVIIATNINLTEWMNKSTVANAEETTSTENTSITWLFDETTGVLHVFGTGDMENYARASAVPWYEHRKNITALDISEKITSIGAYAFAGLVNLTEVNIPKTVEIVEKSAFSGCSNLEKLDLDSVKTIERSAFKECVSLTELHLPDTLTFIGDSFIGCTGLTDVTIPASVTLMKGQTFGECVNLSKVIIENPRLECQKYSYWYEIGPFNGAGVNGISIVLPEGMTKIPDGLCYGCIGMTSTTDIVIPDSITEIGKSAFSHCNNLESFEIPKKVTEIKEDTFAFCSSLKEIDFASVTTIERTAFEECTSLTKLNLPKTLTFIGDSFIGCTGLTEVTIPASVTLMKGQTFGNCKNLSSVVIEAKELKCDKYSYWYEMGPLNGAGVNGIKVEFPDGITEIPYGFFYGCAGLNSLSDITIPDSVTSISKSAFKNCSELETVVLPEQITHVGENAFEECANLLRVDCPLGLSEIGEKSFDSEQIVLYVYRDSAAHAYAVENEIPYVIYNSVGEITLDIKINAAVYKGEEGTVKSGSLYDYDVTLYNETKGMEVPVFVARYGVVSFDIENCNAGDEIKITLANTTGKTTNGTVVVKLDELFGATTEVTVDGFGSAEFSFSETEVPVRVLCFDKDGTLVSAESESNSTKYASSQLERGTYKFIFTSSYSMCWNVNRFFDLEKYGYVEEKNYILREINIEDTVILKEDIGKIPVLESNLLNAFDYTSSMVHVDASMYETSGYVQVTMKAILDKKYDVDNFDYINLKMAIPDGAQIVGDSISLNGKIADFTLKNQEITIKVSDAENTVSFYLTSSNAVNNWVEAYAAYSMGGNKTNENIGKAMIPTSVFKLHVPDTITNKAEIGVWGKSPANQIIEIYDNDVLIATITSAKNGDFVGSVTLNDVENVFSHELVAKVQGNDSLVSNSVEVRYMVSDEACIEIVNAEMTVYSVPVGVHKDYSSKTYNITESLKGTETTKWIWRENCYYKFSIEFENNDVLEAVYILGEEQGITKSIKAEFDEKTQQWVALGRFDENNVKFAPDNLSVVYNIKAEECVENLFASLRRYVQVKEIIDNDGSIIYEVNPEKLGMDKLYIKEETNRVARTNYDVYVVYDELGGAEVIAEVITKDVEDNSIGAIKNKSIESISFATGYDVDILRKCILGVDNLIKFVALDYDKCPIETTQALFETYFAFVNYSPSFATNVIGEMILNRIKKNSIFITALIAECKGMEVDFAIEKADGWRKYKVKAIVTKDPSGYVYECIDSNRLENVKTTIYFKDSTGKAIEWDASEFDQQNPLYTNELGEYEWYVPEGLWQVKYEKEGYETTYSEWLPVPPPQTEVNIGMKSLAEPKIEFLKIDEEQMVLEFAKYMNVDSICRAGVILTDEKGNTYPVTLEALSNEYTYEGEQVEKQFAIKAEGLIEGDKYKLMIDSGISTYAGVKSNCKLIKDFTYVFAPHIEVKQNVYELNYGESLEIPVTLGNYEVGEQYQLTSGEVFNENGLAVIRIDSNFIGEYELDLCLTSSSHVTTILIRVLAGQDKYYNCTPHILTNALWTEVGEPLDLKKSIEVLDYEDGLLNGKVEILKENVDYSKVGKYSVSYYVKDVAGNSIFKTVAVYVVDYLEQGNEEDTKPEDGAIENGGKETEEEQPLEENEQEQGNSDKAQIPNTGDSSRLVFSIVLMAVSLICMAIMVGSKKHICKKKQTNVS